ncbi:SEC14-like protein 2 [Folsomia candida]|uniref:CRAL-TRIO domain-containing protein n=1 Tax=Folsomia candida TaxID=158441 RepID=A0A226EGH8_FOLCA|nr:SEC14-like protein 2 [Folsomia candida]OXA56328.1 hypothetical protein Fcan01_08622 [Folsomia candida]
MWGFQFFLVFLVAGVVFVTGQTLDEDLTLTHSEKLTLDKFKERVSHKLPHKYMQEDIYLVRWLRARKFNVEAAEQMLMENVAWRSKNKMDSVNEEDWSDLEPDFRYSIEGCDNEGRPVVSVFLGDWDIRKAILAGKSKRLMRYIDHLVEEVTSLVRSSQERGMNITQWTLILDMNNYNLAQHGCLQCIPIQLHFLRTLQQHYPGDVHKLHVINTPQVFTPVLQLMKPLFSERARKILTFFGRDKEEWQNVLLRDIARDKLTQNFGGDKESPYEMEHFKQLGYFQCSNDIV